MNATPDAVYFVAGDYAHPRRRIGACLIDFVVLVLLVSAIAALAQYIVVPADVLKQPRTTEAQKQEVQKQINKHMKPVQVPVALISFVVLPMTYHIGLRRLRGGTIGYRLTGVRVVDKKGNMPSWRVLLRRFLIALPSVLPLGAGYFRSFGDPKRQAVHDQWSGTWVIRKRATPAGPAITAYQTKLFGTFPMTYIDVEPFTLSAEVLPTAAGQGS